MSTSSPTRTADDTSYLIATPVGSLLQREPVCVSPNTTVRELAMRMRDHKVSSVLVVEQDRLLGIVTDRDLRNRVVAAGLGTDAPASAVATAAPMTVEAKQPAFDALLTMARYNIHHMPVLQDGRLKGVLSSTDLTRQQSDSAVFMASDIYMQPDVAGLVQVSQKIRRLQHNLAAANATAYSTGHIITAMTDAMTIRLLQLAEAELGPPPIPYVWVAAGSQARSEQTAKSDQDNCMVLDNSYDSALHGDYFKALSSQVCAGLDACGYIYCPGEMMAMTDTWRLPQQAWLNLFSNWIEQPVPKALMLTCVFFDLRAIHGSAHLLHDMRRQVLQKTRVQKIFLAHMVGNALTHRPPLNFWGGLSLIRSGKNKGTVDLKHNGLAPIVDLARVYALAGGSDAVNTHDRLAVAAASGEVTEQRSRDLRDALEHLATLRIRHQARQVVQGVPVNNFMFPALLSNFEKRQLKDAFQVVKDLQDVLAQRYQL